jgi:hypothetical protein
MTEYDRITTDSWTVAFPSDWPDASDSDGALYFESPSGDKGFYISLWLMSDEETRGSRELIESFQSTELSSFFPADETWHVIAHVSEGDARSATGYWEGINGERKYWISGKQIASGKHVLRATFHDYDSSGPEASSDFFSTIVGSLALSAA